MSGGRQAPLSVATVLDDTDVEHFHCHRMSHWTALLCIINFEFTQLPELRADQNDSL